MMYDICEIDYALWQQRETLSNLLNKLELPRLAQKVLTAPASSEYILDYVDVLVNVARKLRNNEVLDVLSKNGFNGVLQ